MHKTIRTHLEDPMHRRRHAVVAAIISVLPRIAGRGVLRVGPSAAAVGPGRSADGSSYPPCGPSNAPTRATSPGRYAEGRPEPRAHVSLGGR